jgi:hypothetical protein
MASVMCSTLVGNASSVHVHGAGQSPNKSAKPEGNAGVNKHTKHITGGDTNLGPPFRNLRHSRSPRNALRTHVLSRVAQPFTHLHIIPQEGIESVK